MTNVSTRIACGAWFYSPGLVMAESSYHALDLWDRKKACQIAKTIVERHGATPFGFAFVRRIEADDIDAGGGTKLKVQAEEIERSGVHYLGGKVRTLEMVEADALPDEKILRSNMRGNGYDAVVTGVSRYKWTQPFRPADVIVDPETGEIRDRGSVHQAAHITMTRIGMTEVREIDRVVHSMPESVVRVDLLIHDPSKDNWLIVENWCGPRRPPKKVHVFTSRTDATMAWVSDWGGNVS